MECLVRLQVRGRATSAWNDCIEESSGGAGGLEAAAAAAAAAVANRRGEIITTTTVKMDNDHRAESIGI